MSVPIPPRESYGEIVKAIDAEAVKLAPLLADPSRERNVVVDMGNGNLEQRSVFLLTGTDLGGTELIEPTQRMLDPAYKAALVWKLLRGTVVTDESIQAVENLIDQAEKATSQDDRAYLGIDKELGLLVVTAYLHSSGGYALRADANNATPEQFLNVEDCSPSQVYDAWRALIEPLGITPYAPDYFPGPETSREDPTKPVDISGRVPTDKMIPMADQTPNGEERPWPVMSR